MTWSKAAWLADEGLTIVDNVLSFAKTTVGNPGKKEQALFLSSTAMAYAVWENYIEQVAIELVSFMASAIDPGDVPEKPKEELAKAGTWALSVHPGWRSLWVDLVRDRAVGSLAQASNYGLNTAGSAQVKKLFDVVGVTAFEGVEDQMSVDLDRLVKDRGTIVHTAQPPSAAFKKADATGWRDFVHKLYHEFDASLRVQAHGLTGDSPW